MEAEAQAFPEASHPQSTPPDALIAALMSATDAETIAVEVRIGNSAAGYVRVWDAPVKSTIVEARNGQDLISWRVSGRREDMAPDEFAKRLWTLAHDYIDGYRAKRANRKIRSAMVSVKLCDVNGGVLEAWSRGISWTLVRPDEQDILAAIPAASFDLPEGLRTLAMPMGGDASVVDILVRLLTATNTQSLRKDEMMLRAFEQVIRAMERVPALLGSAADLQDVAAKGALEGERLAMEGALTLKIAELKTAMRERSVMDSAFGEALANGVAPTISQLLEDLARLLMTFVQRATSGQSG